MVVILAEKSDKEYIRTFLDPGMYDNGMKLTEHSYMDNNFMKVIENLIGPNGMFYKSRLVWAGDYADNEPNSGSNLHKMCEAKSPFVSRDSAVSYTTQRRYTSRKMLVWTCTHYPF